MEHWQLGQLLASLRRVPFFLVIDVELFYLLHRFQIACHQVPVTWKNKAGTRINFLVCMVRDPIDLMRIRFRGTAGIYKKPVPEEDQPWNSHKVI